MISKFFEGLGGELGKRSAAAIVGPASLLLGLGIGAWAMGQDDGFGEIKNYLDRRSHVEEVALGAAVVAVLILLTQAVRLLQTVISPFLQGEWPSIVQRLSDARARQWRRKRDSARLVLLEAEASSPATSAEAREYAQAMLRLREIPFDDLAIRPTGAGNILRAAELRPSERYGLDPAVCWPHLWLCLPEEPARKDLADAHAAMTAATIALTWILVYALLAVWASVVWSCWFALVLGATWLASRWAYRRYVGTARVFARLIDSAFDVHRKELYDGLRWPRPKTPEEETVEGAALSAYLWGGLPPAGKQWV